MSDPIPETFTGPGLLDLQLNGYAGFDFNGPAETWTIETLTDVRDRLAQRGVLAALPTLITDDAQAMLARAQRFAKLLAQEPELETTFPLLHIEGPFISPDEGPRGAHPQAHCRTPLDEPDLLERLIEASARRIGILTLAPELPGALDLIARAAAQGILVALGHTNASTQAIQAAVDAGARMSTHLGNGSHQTLPRLDNYIQTQLADDRLAASFIADGHHMPFTTLKNFLRAKGPQRSILVTDAICAADHAADNGLGRYTVGGEEIIVTEDLRVSKPGQPNLAGSALTLDRAVLNTARRCDIPFAEAWRMASTAPAEILGIQPPPEITVAVHSEAFARQPRL